MQIHGPTNTPDPATFSAYLNPGDSRSFSVVQMGTAYFYAFTPEECDAAIRVWVQAKSLLLSKPLPGREPVRAPLCDASMPLSHGELKCTLDDGHYGAHSAIAGKHRWLGTGDGARTEDGDLITARVPE